LRFFRYTTPATETTVPAQAVATAAIVAVGIDSVEVTVKKTVSENMTPPWISQPSSSISERLQHSIGDVIPIDSHFLGIYANRIKARIKLRFKN
jgi:hypothetical protein